MTENSTRRRVLRAVATGSAVPLLAGCTGDDPQTDTPVSTAAGPTETIDDTFGGWLTGVEGAETLTDLTDESEVRIRVGASGNGGHYAFAPVVARVSPGTTVTWEWTGRGGTHNVVAADESVRSSMTGSAGATFSHTFDAAGVTKYACTPHESMGMKGVVVVE